jgi:glutamine synthetase type III
MKVFYLKNGIIYYTTLYIMIKNIHHEKHDNFLVSHTTLIHILWENLFTVTQQI